MVTLFIMDKDNRPQTEAIVHAWATKQDLDQVIDSKEHFIALFSIRGGYLLPPAQFITWGFIRSVLNGAKELIRLNQVPTLYVPPKVSELTVKSLMSQLKDDERITKFLPDTNRPQDRQYFFAVLATILPNFYETVIRNIKDGRRAEIPEEEKIEVTQHMQALIGQNIPFIGPKKKVGQFLKSGRQWGAPRRQEKREIDIRRIF